MPNIFITPKAEKDIQEVEKYYDEIGKEIRVRFNVSLRECLENIQEFPSLYSETHSTIRRALLKDFPYMVFYNILPDKTDILSVFHTSRKPKE